MGTDMHSWVEVADEWNGKLDWSAVVAADRIIDRNYDMFGCIFGVMNYARFAPLAAGRGMPDDASELVRKEANPLWARHASWITWAELASVDWEEPAPEVDDRLHEYCPDESGKLVYVCKYRWTPEIEELTGLSLEDSVRGVTPWPAGREWALPGGGVLRAEGMRRSQAVDAATRTLFDLMEVLARRFGPERVRWVAWFDQ